MVKSPITKAPAASKTGELELLEKAVYPNEPGSVEVDYPGVTGYMDDKVDAVIRGKKVDLSEANELYHRTPPENAVKILEHGAVKAYDPADDYPTMEGKTTKISLSASPANTYGGGVRFVWNHSSKEKGEQPYKNSIKVELEPVVYYENMGVMETYFEEYMDYLGISNVNEARAQLGVCPLRYTSEAEVMALDDIETPPKRVELWLMRDIDQYNCSCKQTGADFVRWRGYGRALRNFSTFLESYFDIKDQLAESNMQGTEFRLRSCYELVNIGFGESVSGKPTDILFQTDKEGLRQFSEAINFYHELDENGRHEFDTESIRMVMDDYSDIEGIDDSVKAEMSNPRTFKCKC